MSSQTNSLNQAISALVETIQGVGSVRDFDNSNRKVEHKPAPTQKPAVAKQTTPNNVIPMKKFNKKSSGKNTESATPATRDAMHLNTTPFKTKAVGDDGKAPSSSHPGFKDV